MTPVEEARSAGYTPDEINAHLEGQAKTALDAGYSPAEIQQFMKDNVLMTPQFNDTALQQVGTTAMRQVKSPTTLKEAVETGWNWSSLNLGREALKGQEGKLPDMQVTGDTPWYLRGAANLTGVAGDLPAMLTGAVIGGGAASPVTALGGAFALPMALRRIFADAIESGQVATKKDFAEKATGAMWEMAKGWITGAATAGVGKVATGAVSMLPPLAKATLPTAAELATLTEVQARLEGHAPDPQALLDNAVVLGVAKAVLPTWAAAKPVTETYVKTGIPPEKVMYDAVQGDKGVWQDILDGRVPDAYKTQVETEPAPPTQAQQTAVFETSKTEVGKAKTPTEQKYQTWFDSRLKEMQQEDVGQHVLDTLDETGRSPKQVVDEFWKATYPGLPPEVQSRFQKYITRVTGFKPGSIVAVDKQGGTITAKDWQETYPADQAPGKAEDLEGTERGLMALIEMANIGAKSGAFKTPAKETPGATLGVEGPKVEPKKESTAKPAPMTPEQQDRAKAFLSQPFAEIPQMPNEPARPTHINYNYIDTADSTKQALSRISDIYEEQINAQRRSPRTWEQSHQDAAKVLADLLQSDPKTVTKFLAGESASPSTTAQLLARKELTLGFTEELMRSRAALEAKGDAATPEELATFLAQAERVSTIHAGFLGQRADTARALNALKSTKRMADRAQAIQEMLDTYGGPDQVGNLVKMLGEYDNPAQAVAFAKNMTKATNWDMVVEAWKAGLVSGLRTHEVNFLSTAAFSTLRLPIEAMNAVYGSLQRSEDRVMFSEIPARMIGMAAGIRDGVKIAGAILRTGENILGPKTESFSPKIPGVTGEVVRIPFRVLSASDALLKSVNDRSEIYALATRQAVKENLGIGSQPFFNRIYDLVSNPTPEMTAAGQEAALRYTFNRPLGPGGQAFSRMVRANHLEWLFPFITTPGNIFKETFRMTPGLNLAVKEWREDYKAGGARQDRAMSEVMTGGALMTAVMMAAFQGEITGGGQPDKRMRATDRAAGWKPYAIKVNGRYVDGYLRMAPIGPLMGLAADSAEFLQYMTGDERDQWIRMLGFAFAQNVTNQTFATGATSLVNVMQDPSRYGQNYLESLSSSLIPAIVGQTAAERDPLLREIHGMAEAMKARIPGMREGLMPTKDLFGQPIASPDRLWWGSPFSVSATSIDKVRTEASRLGFATPEIPTTVDVVPGKDFKKLDKVRLTPEQKDVFATESGQFAHDILAQEVNKPAWDQLPKIVQRQIFEKTFKKGRDRAQKKLLGELDPSGRTQAVEAIERAMTSSQP